MANLPATTEADKPQELTRVDEIIFDALSRGVPPDQVPRRLAKGNKVLYKKLRYRMKTMWSYDYIQYAVQERVRAMAMAGMVASMPALVRRAQRGRIDAIKFLGELSGVHNPKVSHEHSGDVNLRFIAMPRPDQATVDQTQPQLEEPVVDAEVVDAD
jgi:hypothetical protein